MSGDGRNMGQVAMNDLNVEVAFLFQMVDGINLESFVCMRNFPSFTALEEA